MGELITRPRPPQALQFDGERYTSSFGGQTAIEHWHRYLLARELVRGKDVLDVACGEGYGSALLAQTARSVVAVDLSVVAVAHAREAYPSENLRYLEGNAVAIPVEDASVDVVVSFETIEHFREHDRFLSEIRRVLRPGGLLVISTPDRDNYSPAATPANPFHQLELTAAEFRVLLSRHFGAVHMQGQRILLGSALLDEEASNGVPLTFERRGDNHFEVSTGPARAKYLVAFASNGTLPSVPGSVYVDADRLLQVDGPMLERIVAGEPPPWIADHLARLEAKVTELASHIAERDRVNADLTAVWTASEAKVRELASRITEQDRVNADLTAVWTASELKIAEFIAFIAERDRAIADLMAERRASRKESQRLAIELGEAEAERRRMVHETEAAKV